MLNMSSFCLNVGSTSVFRSHWLIGWFDGTKKSLLSELPYSYEGWTSSASLHVTCCLTGHDFHGNSPVLYTPFCRWEIRGFFSGPLWLWHIKFQTAANRNNDGRFLDQSSVKQFQSLESSRSARPGPLSGNMWTEAVDVVRRVYLYVCHTYYSLTENISYGEQRGCTKKIGQICEHDLSCYKFRFCDSAFCIYDMIWLHIINCLMVIWVFP